MSRDKDLVKGQKPILHQDTPFKSQYKDMNPDNWVPNPDSALRQID